MINMPVILLNPGYSVDIGELCAEQTLFHIYSTYTLLQRNVFWGRGVFSKGAFMTYIDSVLTRTLHFS